MKAEVKYEPPDDVLVIRAENKKEAAILTRFLRPNTTVFTLARNRAYKNYPDLEIRKAADKCQNTHKP